MPAPAIKQTPQGLLPADLFKRSELEKLAKKLDKAMPDALQAILDVVVDKAADPKLKLDAAKFVLDTKIRVTDAMSKDAMQKAVLLIKAQASSGIKTINPQESSATYDFNHIAKIDGVNYDATDEDGSVDLTYLKVD